MSKSMPLGMIKDINPNHNSSDVWALISNNQVVNTILASYNDILAIYKSYDYCVDITMNGAPTYGIGNTYNPSNDTFIAPPAPPIDWPLAVEYDFDGLISNLQQISADCGPSGGNLTPQQINAAYNSALNDNPGLDQPTLTLLLAVYNYIIAGG